MPTSSFRNLDVWQEAMTLVLNGLMESIELAILADADDSRVDDEA